MKKYIWLLIFLLLPTFAFAGMPYFKGTEATEDVVYKQRTITIGEVKKVVDVAPTVEEATVLEVGDGIYRTADIPAYTEDPETKEKTYNADYLGDDIMDIINKADKGNADCIAATLKGLWAIAEYTEGEETKRLPITLEAYKAGGEKEKIVSEWVPIRIISGEEKTITIDQKKVERVAGITPIVLGTKSIVGQ
jgi:hypothetical protein